MGRSLKMVLLIVVARVVYDSSGNLAYGVKSSIHDKTMIFILASVVLAE